MNNFKTIAGLCILLLLFSGIAFADLKILNTTEEFEKTVAEAQVPVIVQFSAYWCPPCQKLKAKLTEIAPEYSDNQVLICYVDAYVNSELKKYLDGGYPTTRTFRQGKTAGPHFVGDKPESQIREYINNTIDTSGVTVVSVETIAQPNTLVELKSLEEFNKAIQSNNVPVIVQFSAHWCPPCQSLKARLKQIAPGYNTDKVRLYYVDAYVISELKKYLMGGYPTTRTFAQGKVEQPSFVGDKPDAYVRNFIDEVIEAHSGTETSEANSLVELKSLEEFNQAIASAQVPVIVQFSAHWCPPCKSLKARLARLAPNYQTSQVRIYYVDAYVITQLKKYLMGGYPTTRTFVQGKVDQPSFVGDKSDSQVKSFIDSVIK